MKNLPKGNLTKSDLTIKRTLQFPQILFLSCCALFTSREGAVTTNFVQDFTRMGNYFPQTTHAWCPEECVVHGGANLKDQPIQLTPLDRIPANQNTELARGVL